MGSSGARLQDDAAYRDEVFRRAMTDVVRGWMDLAQEKLAGSDVRSIDPHRPVDAAVLDGVPDQVRDRLGQTGGVPRPAEPAGRLETTGRLPFSAPNLS